MGAYYLDIETNGLDEVQNKIITIQYVELENQEVISPFSKNGYWDKKRC